MEINKIYQGDALSILKTFPDEYVDCVMTSPPYWNLRDYHTEGQLGLEDTFEEYLEKLINIFDKIKRVLKNEGTCWVNIGDCYTDKSLCLAPFHFALRMADKGWILRNDIAWYKRNSLPTSVKDRLANKWEHIFFFTKSKKYYFDLDVIRKPHLLASTKRINAGFSDKVSFDYRVREATKGTLQQKFGDKYKATEEEILQQDKHNTNPLGGNPGDYWDITTQPHPFAHFACYPERLCEIPIKAGCPEKGIVLDPFIGSGTTGLVALKNNRNFIGIELNQEYIKIAEERLKPFLHQSKLC